MFVCIHWVLLCACMCACFWVFMFAYARVLCDWWNQYSYTIESLLVPFSNCFIFIQFFNMWVFWLNICICVHFVPAEIRRWCQILCDWSCRWLWTTTWIIEPGSCVREASAFHIWAISPNLTADFLLGLGLPFYFLT